jgi:hypothetical protein
VKVRVYLLRRASRRRGNLSYVTADVQWRYWVNVLGVYRDARRSGATETDARALIYFTLRALEAVS